MSDPSEPADAIVTARCPHCGAGHPVREQVLGKLARCTACEQRFVLRVDEPHEPPPAAAALPISQPTESRKPPPFAPRPAIEAPPAPPAAEPTAFEVPLTPLTCRLLGLAARASEVFAAVGVLLGTLWCVVLMIVALAQVTETSQLLLTVAGIGTVWCWVIAASVLLVLAAQLVRLGLRIEQNTRETAAACRALATRSVAKD